MGYFIDLFSPETYSAFSESDRTITGFRPRQRRLAARLGPGDLFLCYVTRLSRWVGLLEIESTAFDDQLPVFASVNDPFSLRFRVKPLVWLSLENGVPIHDDELWDNLSFTRGLEKNNPAWTGIVRGSLARIDGTDAAVIQKVLERQQTQKGRKFVFSTEDLRKMKPPRVRVAPHQELPVSIPTREEESRSSGGTETSPRESFRIQASLAKIGERMGYKIWLPKSDRSRVLEHWKPEGDTVIEALPLNYDEATLNTVEQIDVLWLRRRTIIRAFEVEHTTSIYSGILRMADLLALQPNLEIKAHIVAPYDRREKVMQELTRPVFALLEGRPLASACTYLSYEAISDLSSQRLLEHMADSVVDEFVEEAES